MLFNLLAEPKDKTTEELLVIYRDGKRVYFTGWKQSVSNSDGQQKPGTARPMR